MKKERTVRVNSTHKFNKKTKKYQNYNVYQRKRKM